MAILLADSFDFYSTAGTAEVYTYGPWTSAYYSESWAGVTTGGRFATGRMFYSAGVAGNRLDKTLAANSTNTIYFNLAFYYGGSSGAGDKPGFINLNDGGTNQVSINFRNDGAIYVYRNGTQIAAFTSAFSLSTWIHWQIKVVIDPTAGEIRIRKDGSATDTFSATGLNTRATANSYITNFSLGSSGVNAAVYYDDVLVLDSSGSTANTWTGDVRCYSLAPTGAGSATDFAVTGAATNWQANTQIPADGDTSYTSSATLNAHDLFAMGDLTTTPAAIIGVVQRVVAKKSDAGTRSLQCELKSGTTTSQGSSASLGTTYGGINKIWETDPDTGSAWTASAVNALEAGYKVSV